MPRLLTFIGDSITDAGRRDDADGLGRGFVRRVAERLGGDADVVNTGIGGHRAKDLLARWQEDALSPRPDVLTVYVGINDTWRRYDDDDPTSAESFGHDYRRMLQRAVDAGVPRIILVEPFVAPVTPEQGHWIVEDLGAKQAAVAALAREFGASFVPLQRVVDDAAASRGAAAVAWDGVHPTPLGDALIADAWWAAYAGDADTGR